MEIKEMTIDQLMERRTAIAAEIDAPEADLDALEAEARAINEELEARRSAEAQRTEIRNAVAGGAGETTKTVKTEERKVTIEEIRSSKEYINAFANYIKTGKDEECRALLSTNSDVEENPGQVPVPTVIEGRIRTAWERNGLMNLVRKTYIRGNLSVGFELSATDAEIHAEGTDAPEEEELTFGVVTMVPQSIKKWITISDEALDMGGEEFLDYIYDELTYRIARAAEIVLLGLVATADTSATSTAVSVEEIESDGSDILGIVANAIAHLADGADNPVIVMNKLSYAAFKAAQYSANYAVDPFEGLRVFYNSNLADISTASDDDIWLIVGDFGYGAQANFPNGDEIRIKYDDLSLAERDLVKLVGREYIGLGLVNDKAFCRVKYVTVDEG